jgi:hypothetical protein
MGASADLLSPARIDFRSDQRRVSDNGCSRNGQSWPLASQHAESRLTVPRPVRQAPSGRQPKPVSKQDGFRCCTAHGSVRRKSGRANGASESIVPCEVPTLVGVPDLALTRLQNLVSGAWLKKRVSVAAGASGRGLVVGGSNCQRRTDRRKTLPRAGSGPEDTGRETSEESEKGSLPEEDVSGRVSHRIHAIRW